ncbi:MAG: c-type cytochrome, partial [Planctomycetaceae bacterium]|nr:c-type cytochrome [Planctomycetaceae bacterium]
CDAGLGKVLAFHPNPMGSGYRFEQTALVWSEPVGDGHTPRDDGLAATWFRPTDVAFADDGTLFVSDWYDSYVGAHRITDEAGEGRIYAVRRAGAQGQSASPRQPDAASDASVTSDCRSDVEVAMAAWLQAVTPGAETTQATALLQSPTEELRATGLRILRESGEATSMLAASMMHDPSPVVRREVALLLQGLPFEDAQPVLLTLATQLDPDDRVGVEAFGLVAEPFADELFSELLLRFDATDELQAEQLAAVAWRLHPPSALPFLTARLRKTHLPVQSRIATLNAIALIRSHTSEISLRDFTAMISNPETADEKALLVLAQWWLQRMEGEWEKSASGRPSPSPLPVRYQVTSTIEIDDQQIATIAHLPGEAARGAVVFFARETGCAVCHQLQGRGGRVGPDLSSVARRLNRRQLAEAIVYPSASFLTGYESWAVVDRDGAIHTGLLMSATDAVVLKTKDDQTERIPRESVEELVRQSASLMPDFRQAGLTDQQVADLIAFLFETSASK